MKVQTKNVKVYTASDGKEFADKAGAVEHQAGINLVSFLSVAVAEDAGHRILDAIRDDIDGFREVVQPLLRRPRVLAQDGIDFNDVDPAAPEDPAPTTRRRGRPRKDTGNGARAEA